MSRDTFIDPSSNFHPYNCDGPGACIHCDRTVTATHDPAVCGLCSPVVHDDETEIGYWRLNDV